MEIYNKGQNPVVRWILAIILLLVFTGLLLLVKNGYAQYFDDPIREFLYGLRSDWLTAIIKVITALANPLTLVVICVLLLVFPKTTLKIGIPLAIVTGLGALAHKGIKHLVLRERPDTVLHLIEESGYSFPSGHANAGLIFYLFLAFLIGRYLKQKKRDDMAHLIYVIAAIIVFLIGVSRVYLGVHFPTDIIAGWCLGGILLIIFITVYDAVYPRKYHLALQSSDGKHSAKPDSTIKNPEPGQ